MPEAFTDKNIATITDLSHEGLGIATYAGKKIFLEQALPEEKVRFQIKKRHPTYDEGVVEEILSSSSQRVIPRCEHFGVCGGCQLQHMSQAAQLNFKQEVLLNQLRYVGKVSPQVILLPITGSSWHYRAKARLSVKYVPKKGGAVIGFHEKNTHYVTHMQTCPVLIENFIGHLPALKNCLNSLEGIRVIPQIEIAGFADVVGVVFRHLAPFSAHDLEKLTQLGKDLNWHIYLQPKGLNSIHLLVPAGKEDLLLEYAHPNHHIKLKFHPAGFMQINPEINQKLVDLVCVLLDLKPQDRVLDLFCGLGNFSLPVARYCEAVVGVEGAKPLVDLAKQNAMLNGMTNVDFFEADLNHIPPDFGWAKQNYDKVIIDPPRSGAKTLVQLMHRFSAKQIVYVSCNPATLARDAAMIVEQGYHLRKAGIVDMFPQTYHTESLALFEKIT